MMNEIPVTFELKGKEYRGVLSNVMGAGGGSMYHLNVGCYFWGQLWYVDSFEPSWRFFSNAHPELDKQAEFFGYVVVAWMDSHPDTIPL